MRTKIIAALLLLSASPALAGRGSSPGAIANAIDSNSVDAIAAELERAEHLVCGSCVRMVRPLLDHGDRRVRQVAAWWLARRGLIGELQETMTARVSSADMVAARNAADVLGELRSVRAVPALGKLVGDPARPAEARSAAARALGEIGELSALPALKQAMAAPEPAVRAAATESLRALRGFRDASVVTTLLADPDEDVRVQAIYTIGATRGAAMAGAGATTTAQALATVVTSDASARVRKKAAWALGEIGAPASVAGTALSQAAGHDPDPLVRSLAAASQGKLQR